MPNVYVRKSNKGSWSEEDLQQAINAIRNGLSIRSAGKQFKIPESTLRSRLKRNVFEKTAMGPECQLGVDAENKLAVHIKKLQAVGFAPTQRDVRALAYDLAESLQKKHTFNREKKLAGKVWFSSFMRRHPELSIRKAQGISRARTEGMNRAEVKSYFTLLTEILTENDLLDKPASIWNCDEIGVQLNNEPGKVVAVKGSKDVHVVTSAEKGETITVLACCSAEGQFLPPYCIFKGVYVKPTYLKGAPPGTVIKMRKESAYISSGLFMDWITQHFIPRKPAGKNLLILDGHASHMNSADMLQVASDNDIIIVCLPSHTTHYLQPLDRVVFKPFKTYFKDACARLVATRRGTGRITREDFGELLNSAWSRAATVQLATSSFRATGIYPLNMGAIPEHAYLLSCDQDALREDNGNPDPVENTDLDENSDLDTPDTPSAKTSHTSAIPTTVATLTPSTPPSTAITSEGSPIQHAHPFSDQIYNQPSTSMQAAAQLSLTCTPRTSKVESLASANISPVTETSTSKKTKITPNKALATISPIPCSLGPSKVKRKINATNVTSPEYINDKRKKTQAAMEKKKKTEVKKKQITYKKKQLVTAKNQNCKLLKRNKHRTLKQDSPPSTSSDEDSTMELLSDTLTETDDEACVECLELYSVTTSQSDWIKCISCDRWLHESCSVYLGKCCDCGRREVRQRNSKK